MHNEQQKQESQRLELELEQEKRKHEAHVERAEQLRDSEINQVKSLSENNLIELKLRERELHESKMMENVLRKRLCEARKELEDLASNNSKRRDRIQALHNFRRVKMLMRERSDAIKRDIAQDLTLLDRISFDKDIDNDEEIRYLREKFLGEQDNEVENLKQIECMYESEAKDALKKQEEKWNDAAMIREQQLKVLLDDRTQTLSDRINDCVRKQRELSAIRETHLKAIEDCNQRLKELMSESLSVGLNDAARKTLKESTINDNNLNGVIRKTDNLMINGHHYQLAAPRFARKKVVWT
jgi:trichoplein keratin filament-binding protein